MRATTSTVKSLTAAQLKALLKQAVAAMKRAYAPYSQCKVGAALRTVDGKIFSGCNVENASYGGTVCAERVALWKSVSEGSRAAITDLVIVTKGPEAWPPCGFCRQVMTEFAGPECRVHLATPQKIVNTYLLGELMPHSFTGRQLK